MSQVFGGSVLLPGETGPGLQAAIEMRGDMVRLVAGADELGTWGAGDVAVEPSGKGAFRVAVGADEVFFTPSSPSSFAEAMHVPLQPDVRRSKHTDQTYDIDAAIDEAIAKVKPLRNPEEDDDILSAPMVVTIVLVAGALMAGLIGLSLLI